MNGRPGVNAFCLLRQFSNLEKSVIFCFCIKIKFVYSLFLFPFLVKNKRHFSFYLINSAEKKIIESCKNKNKRLFYGVPVGDSLSRIKGLETFKTLPNTSDKIFLKTNLLT